MNLEPHALADLFPPMDSDRLQELADDIKKNGQLQPIVLHEGKILDGRSRYIAARMAGREPVTVDFNASEYNRTPVEFVASMNFQRRDLTPSQRATIGADLLEKMRYKTGPKVQRDTFGQKPGSKVQRDTFAQKLNNEPEDVAQASHLARKEAAEKARVSERYVGEAAALKHKDPEAFAEVKAGRKTLRQATRSKRERSRASAFYLNGIAGILGQEPANMINSGEVKLKPKQLASYANQPPATMKAIWPLLAQGIPYTDAIKSTGGEVLSLSSSLDKLTGKWIEECGAPDKENKVLTVCIDPWRITVERVAG